MQDRLLKYLNYGNRFCGVEYNTKDGEEIINVSLLKQFKKELQIVDFFEASSIEAVTQKLSKNQHIYLVLNNEKILTRTIESEQRDGLKLVHKAFPNINLEEFYYEVLSQANTHHIALCRKSYVEDIIKLFSSFKFSVIAIALGNTIVGSICGFISQDCVYSSNAKIDIKDNAIVQIEKKNTSAESYNINGLRVSNQQLLSFSAALQTVLKNNKVYTNLSDIAIELNNDFKQTRFFNLFLKIGGIFILCLLLINFFFFSFYFKKVTDLKQVSEINQTTKSQIIRLTESVAHKQKTVDDLLRGNVSKTSFYIDRIIRGLPKSMILSEFIYQPLLKRIKANKAIKLEEKKIIVSGTLNNSEAFSSWINQLEQEYWINKVDIIDYASSSSVTSDFKIGIVLNND